MAFHLIITCVSKKRAKKAHSILDPSIEVGTLKNVFTQWNNMLLSSKLRPKKAIDLYNGSLWNSCLDAMGNH